jgi:putative ABC transport system substrate-binding protein
MMMDRRAFFRSVGAAVVAAPVVTEAQPHKRPRIGFLQGTQNENTVVFMQALRDAGYVDGHTAVVDARIYGTSVERLTTLTRELVALKCDVIFAAAPYAIKAAMEATSTIAVVGVDLESDPVANGWARSLRRPGRNFSGIFLDLPELSGKQVQLLKEAVPGLSRLAILWDSTIGEVQFRAATEAARTAGVSMRSLPIRQPGDIHPAFATVVRERLQGMIVLSSPLIIRVRQDVADLALKHHVPMISLFTTFPQVGGLMAYGPDLPEMYRRAVSYVDRVLQGSTVGDLPIERPTKFDFIINVKTAKAVGLAIPQSLLVRADHVIH